MPKGRPIGDLGKNPQVRLQNKRPELPVNTALDKLSKLNGEELEISTRSSTVLNRAAAAGFIYAHTFGSGYASARVEQIERLAVSVDGQGRRDVIDAIAAGGKVPDEYLNGDPSRGDFENLRDDGE